MLGTIKAAAWQFWQNHVGQNHAWENGDQRSPLRFGNHSPVPIPLSPFPCPHSLVSIGGGKDMILPNMILPFP